MTNEQAQVMLAEIYRRWPNERRFADPTAELWLEGLAEIKVGHALAAISILWDREERRPSWATFLAECHEEARIARLAARTRQVRLGQVTLPVATERDAVWVEAIRAALDGGVRHSTECDIARHTLDRRTCTHDCPWGAFIGERVGPAPIEERAVYPCGRCLAGRGILVLEDGTTKPCPACNGPGHDLWRAGHFEPGHSCDECSPNPRRRHVSADA